MSTKFSQEGRLGKFHSPIGFDHLVLSRFSGHDVVNGLFHYEVETLGDRDDIEFDDLLGLHASVDIHSATSNEVAWFDGIVTQIEWRGARDGGQSYVIHLQPWIYLMSLRQNQRIFHDQTVEDILRKVFDAYASSGSKTYDISVKKDYPVLEYTVQYRESDLDFALRLMERFGLSYYFTHEQGSHTLHVTDAVDTCPEYPGGTAEYLGSTGDKLAESEHFWDWAPFKRISTGSIRLTDFHFKKPDTSLELDQAGDHAYAQGALESYIFPGDLYPDDLDPEGNVNTEAGRARAALRLNQMTAQSGLHRGVGNTLLMKSGMRVVIEGEKMPRVTGKSFVCMRAEHNYTGPSYGTGAAGVDESFTGQYLFQKEVLPFVPRLSTETPVVFGPQTAKVVGTDEVDVDEYGRILVHFPWDLDAEHSMRCRVSQSWAGKGWGGMVIPRIGMEVVVEFIEGDPDQPLVTGCVYNHTNMPHYKLPDEKTRSTFRTDSSVGNGFNEFSFEDKAGSEEIYLRAQKDMNAQVGNNKTTSVEANRVEIIGNSSISQTNNSTWDVVVGHCHLSVGPQYKDTFTKAGHPAYQKSGGEFGPHRPDDASTLPASQSSITLGTDIPEGQLSYFVDGFRINEIVKTDFLKIGEERTVDVGKDYVVDVGKSYKLTATDSITLEVGKSKLVMKKDGSISLEGMNVSQKATASFKIKGAKTDIN